MIVPEPQTRAERIAHRLGVTCAVFLTVGLAVGFTFAAGVYFALLAKVFWAGWHLGWGLW